MGITDIPITMDWDRAIMDTYPYRVANLWADHRNFSRFDEIIEWSKTNFDRDDFTWKNMTFFFRKKDDMVAFMLRWA